jgi:hypothetical protein
LKNPITSSGIEPTTCRLASYLKETGYESAHWIHLPQAMFADRCYHDNEHSYHITRREYHDQQIKCRQITDSLTRKPVRSKIPVNIKTTFLCDDTVISFILLVLLREQKRNGTAMGNGRDDRSSISGKVKITLLHNMQTGYEDYPVSYRSSEFLRPTDSRPVRLRIGPPFRTLDQILSCSSFFC